MVSKVFMDSSGLYGLSDVHDSQNAAATSCVLNLTAKGTKLVLTDCVIDESVTLAVARSGTPAALRMLDLIDDSDSFDIHWITPARFSAAKAFFRKHSDHKYSFTDCTSFVVMRELGLRDALTTDRHFAEAGFRPLLPII